MVSFQMQVNRKDRKCLYEAEEKLNNAMKIKRNIINLKHRDIMKVMKMEIKKGMNKAIKQLIKKEKRKLKN